MVESNMKLSIIVPVYRVESTLDRCIESVLRQDYEDWEMLLIDDGSPDNCPAMCDAWAQRDRRIIAHHKPNGGLSDARNYGIERAKGEYITFVDSDDELAPNTLHPLMNLLEGNSQCDILEYSVSVYPGHESEHILSLPDIKWNSASKYWHSTRAWDHCYAWNKLYKRRLYDMVSFPKGRVYEDVWMYPELLALNPNVITTSLGKYIYRWHPQSISNSVSADRIKQFLESLLHARTMMHTSFFSCNGWHFYRSMLCRQIDLYRLSGCILLKYPFVPLICSMHKKLKKKY